MFFVRVVVQEDTHSYVVPASNSMFKVAFVVLALHLSPYLFSLLPPSRAASINVLSAHQTSRMFPGNIYLAGRLAGPRQWRKPLRSMIRDF